MILLTAARGATQTRIMHATDLPYTQLLGYLDYLLKGGMLEYYEERQMYIVTDKAMKFLDASNEMNEILPFRRAWYS